MSSPGSKILMFKSIGSQLTSGKQPTFSSCAPSSKSKPLHKICCELKKELSEGTKLCLLRKISSEEICVGKEIEPETVKEEENK